MSQPSNPATAYFKAAVKVLRLQRALSRSKSASESKDSSSASPSPANSTPCTTTTPSFQHTNGRKVSYLQYHNKHNHHHNHNHHPHHSQSHHGRHYRTESFDTPLYTLQRKRHTVSSSSPSSFSYSTGHHSPSSAASFSHKHGVCKEVISLPSTSNKHSRRSASPATFPVFSIQQQQQQQKASTSSLSRSKSMPNRRWRRASHHVVVVPQHLDIWVAGLAPAAAYENNNFCLPHQSLLVRSRASSIISMSSLPSSPQHQDQEEKETALSDTCERGVQEEVLDRVFECIPNPTVYDSGLTSIDATTTAVTTLQRSNTIKSAPLQQGGKEQVTGGSSKKSTAIVPGSRPSRSFTSSSLSSNTSSVSSTAMPLADSRMSIESQRSESSLLSAVISAGGLPSMDVMMDQVDRSIAADGQAQLVENAHVGQVAYISVVDRNLLPEPCSAEIETWVS
ncbi:hypothetical protein BGZ47_003787 [Haplosporangium gracile]|nr:hypothetical protein BGZ47_003787 [Haplosporangium gracile]